MNVIIGIDPHKATHTAVAIGCDEAELATVTVPGNKTPNWPVVGVGRAVPKANVGHRVRPGSRLFAGPTARRCR